jgi:transposase-like protein
MSQIRKTKEEIVVEYFTGNYNYRELGLKYNIPLRSICDWVLEYQGCKPRWREKMKRKREKETGMKEPELSNEVKLLQKELKKQQLHHKLLEEIISITHKETGTDWKKSLAPSNHEYQAN